MKYYTFLFLALFISCNNPKKVQNIKKHSILENSKKEPFSKKFVLKNDTINQILFCNAPKNHKIKFKVIYENLKTNEHFVIEGTAKARNSFDGEVDEDENGDAYFSDEYFYNDNFKLRIDSEDGDKAKIITLDNKNISQELMRLK